MPLTLFDLFGEDDELADLPPTSPQSAFRLARQAADEVAYYNMLKQKFDAAGWLFTDLLGDGLPSDVKVNSNGTWLDDGDVEATNHWNRDYDTGKWLPHPVDGNAFEHGQIFALSFYFLFDRNDFETYVHAKAQLPFLLDQKKKFAWGVASRVVIRMWQLRAALWIREVWCLDIGD